MIRKLTGFFVNLMIDYGLSFPYIFVLFFTLKEVQSKSAIRNGVTLLALNPLRFRGDLQVLADQGFKVYMMPYSWQARVLHAYKLWNKGDEFYHPSVNSPIYRDRIRLQGFLKKILAKLFILKKIDCVIGASFYYYQDIDWGLAAKQITYPYIVFYRECLLPSKGSENYLTEAFKSFGKFEGTHIVLHNEKMRRLLTAAGVADSEQSSALGTLRMDAWLRKIHSYENTKKNNRITLFSFFPKAEISAEIKFDDLEGLSWANLYRDVHLSFIELAHEHSEIEVVIKTKWDASWSASIEKIAQEAGFNLQSMPNLIITSKIDAQELIFNSDVLSGWGSTTLLESCIAKKSVVYPMFDEVKLPEYRDYIGFYNALEMFQLAHSKEEYKQMIMDEYHKPSVTPEMMSIRNRVFEEQVSSLDADAAGKYTRLLIDFSARYRQKRMNK